MKDVAKIEQPKGIGATPCDFHVEEGPQPGCDLCKKINEPAATREP